MENASKALLIAGGVLITMLILVVAVILYNSYSNTSEQYIAVMNATEISKFNNNFQVFVGRSNIKAQEIITLYNKIEEYKKTTYIRDVTITVTGANINEGTIKFLQNNLTNEFQYVENSIDYYDDGQVKTIKFTKK